MKDDLISRQALRDAMYHEAFETDTKMQRWDSGCWIRYKLFENVIDNLPPAQPEPHYCKECKWSRCHINVDKHGKSETYWWCLNWDGGTDEEGYCYEWEKRTDE